MSYPAVPHSHVVPVGYLRAWAHGPEIAMRLVGSEQSISASVRDVGVRSNFYRRELPKTGEKIYDVDADEAATKVIQHYSSDTFRLVKMIKTRAPSPSRLALCTGRL